MFIGIYDFKVYKVLLMLNFVKKGVELIFKCIFKVEVLKFGKERFVFYYIWVFVFKVI